MSTKSKELFEGSKKLQNNLLTSLTTTTFDTLLANRIPVSIADKLSKQIVENIDLTSLYHIISSDIQPQRFPKQRILDRTIVHMFEMLYQIINAQQISKDKTKKNEFFALVPRGECLDLFLKLVKENCMGDAEIEHYTYEIEPLIGNHCNESKIDWDALYKSDDFKNYLTRLLNLILAHLREDPKPIPALENKIPIRYHPYRINSFLNEICKLKQTGKLNLKPKKKVLTG